MPSVIRLARREQGILVAPGNPLGLSDMASIATSRARMAQRPAGAGAQLLLLALLARAGIALDDLSVGKPAFPTGPDIARADPPRSRIDCGIATRSAWRVGRARFPAARLGTLRPRAAAARLFRGRPQALFNFVRLSVLRDRAAELGGYDVSDAGVVRLVN